MASHGKTLEDSSDEQSEGGSSSGTRSSVIRYTERGIAFPAKISLSSEESEEDSSISDKNSHIQTPSRHQSSEFEEEFSLRARSVSSSEDDANPAETALIATLEAIPEIAGRYSDADPEFTTEWSSRLAPPPLVTQWTGRPPFQGGRGGRGGGGRGGWNDRGHQNNDDRHNNKRRHDDQGGYDDRQNKWRRDDQYRGGRGGYDNNRRDRGSNQYYN